MILTSETSGLKFQGKKFPVYYGKEEPLKHYLSAEGKIYSDKLAKFVCDCNEASGGKVISRIAQIYRYIYIDEVQDLAGYDLELVMLLMKADVNVCLVGDPRQVTYLTNHPKKYPKYKDGDIKGFIRDKLPKKVICEVDETTLSVSHRNSERICVLSSKLYPNLSPSKPCLCESCELRRTSPHNGIFFVHPDKVEDYLKDKEVVQLRWDNRVNTSSKAVSCNFGNSKGLGFDHVLIYPTKDMLAWLEDNSSELKSGARAKLYVAITRARCSIGVVSDRAAGISAY